MKETSAYYFLRTANPKHSAAGAADDVHKGGYIVLHEQNIIYLLAQVERTDKDQSDRNTAVPAAGQAGQHDEHKYNAGGTQQGGGGEQHALQNARHKRSHEDTA